MRLRQRDIDALRIGVEKQTRDACAQEESKRIVAAVLARERVTEVELRQARSLRAGDRLVASDNGQSFYIHGTVRNAERVDDTDYIWVESDCATGSSGGDRRSAGDLVLIERRGA